MRRDEEIMTAVLEFATFTVRDGHEVALIAERDEMIEALRQAFPGLLAAWLTRRDDGTWVDVILWRARAEAETAARQVCNVEQARACRRPFLAVPFATPGHVPRHSAAPFRGPGTS